MKTTLNELFQSALEKLLFVERQYDTINFKEYLTNVCFSQIVIVSFIITLITPTFS